MKEERGISFEEVARAILSGAGTRKRNRSKNHPHQRIFLVKLRGKTWVIPFQQRGDSYHLFTIYKET